LNLIEDLDFVFNYLKYKFIIEINHLCIPVTQISIRKEMEHISPSFSRATIFLCSHSCTDWNPC